MDVAFFLGAMFGFMVALLSYELATAAGEDRVVRWLKRLWPNEKPYLIRNGDKYGVAKKGFYEIKYYSFIHRKYFAFLVDGSWTDREAAEAFITVERHGYESV